MTLVLKGGTLIDGTGTQPMASSTIVIDGELIAAVGRDDEIAIPFGADVVDVTGKTVLPGLINTHTHLCWDCVGDLKEQSHFDTPMMVALKYGMNMRHCLQAGVTTIRDMGAPYGIPLVAKQAVDEGIITGPRLFHSGRPLSITGGHASWMGTREVDGVDEVRKGVREQVREGASWIKIMASGSREEGLSRKGTVWTVALPEFSMEELRTAAEEAHAAGKKITAHATEIGAIRNCVAAGFDAIEHGGPFDAEVLELMVANGVWLVPTFSPANLQVERGAAIGMPEFEIDRRRGQIDEDRDDVLRAARAGVKIAMGTDAGSPAVPNNEVAREIELLHSFGVCETPMEAIIVATRHGAELLGVADEVGTLEPGKVADVVVIDGDPLEDLGALRAVSLVSLGGELVVRGGSVLR
jgi:imidazolonepropionase-like amidohydrolase